MDANLKRKLEELGRALSAAIGDSPETSRQLAELREEGYSVYLLLESEAEKSARTAASERAAAGRARSECRLGGEPAMPAERQLETFRAAPTPPPPAFQIDGRDLAFLRSVGIDPTRSPRRKKSGG